MSPRPFRICLIQHSTRSDNMGVGALIVSEVNLLHRIGDWIDRRTEITIADWTDRRCRPT